MDDSKTQVIKESHYSFVKSSKLQSETQLDLDDTVKDMKPPPMRKNEGEQSGVSFDSISASVKDTTGKKENAEHFLESNIDTKNPRTPEELSKQTKTNNSLQRDGDTYELEKFNKNVMIIFNHEHFLFGVRRLGTALDVAALDETFKQFRFDVTTRNDLTKENLFDELERFSKMNFNDYGCICVAILTHGQDGGFLKAYDTRYSEREAFSCFDALANPTLVAKPIVFLIQACRGPTAAKRVPHDRVQNVEFDADDTLENGGRPTESDMIIFHSSFFGRASVRVVDHGTWFIQTVCKQIKLHGSTDHLEELFLKVRQNVAAMEYNGIKQMPVVTSTLLKKLYLKKIDDTNTKVTVKCESDCRDDTYQPIDLNSGCAHIASNVGSAPNDTYNGGSAPDDTYNGGSAPDDTYNGGSAPDDTYNGGSAPNDTYNGGSAPDDTYNGVPAPDDTYNGPSAPDDTYNSGSAPDDTYNGGSAPDDTYKGGSALDDTYNGDAAPDDTYNGGSTPDDSNNGGSAPDDACEEQRVSLTVRKRQYRVGLNLFNKEPERGIAYLISYGFLENSPGVVACFLIKRKGLSKQMIGEYLSNLQNHFNMAVLECFVNELNLHGMAVDVALRHYQAHFRLPGDAHKIERLVQVFVRRYCVCNTNFVQGLCMPDIIVLAFAIIMLNTDLHTPNLKPEARMSLDDFVRNLRGVDNCGDIDRDMLAEIYERVKSSEFRPGLDHVTQVMRIQAMIVGKKPHLALPHRRLVCYCRLYEIPDIHKKQHPGVHQREVWLFNDLLVITKIFNEKKSSVTYTFRQSFPLCGMIVNLFSVPHYPFGIRLSRRADGRRLVTFNARNEHERCQFVRDLRESVAEMDDMEAIMRI